MFRIDTTQFKTACNAFNEGSQQLNRAGGAVEDVSFLIRDLSSMGPIIEALGILEENIRKESRQEEALYDTGIRIATRYENCEDEIILNQGNEKFIIEMPQYRVADFGTQSIRANNRIDQKTLNEILELFN